MRGGNVVARAPAAAVFQKVVGESANRFETRAVDQRPPEPGFRNQSRALQMRENRELKFRGEQPLLPPLPPYEPAPPPIELAPPPADTRDD